MKFPRETQNMDKEGILRPPPKKFCEVKRIRTTPYNPFKNRHRGVGQENRWTTFKRVIMNIPSYCK